MQALEERDVACPYCGEHFAIVLDHSAGEQAFIEDCFVCCQPIQFFVRLLPGAMVEVIAKTDSE